MSSKVFALIDCNAFYVSCERVFNPKLNNRPVVALSNNDGCIISRSKEAKALGIKMGVPLFKVKDIVNKYDTLEKELSSGNIEPKLFAKKSKEYSSLGRIISVAREYLNFENVCNLTYVLIIG